MAREGGVGPVETDLCPVPGAHPDVVAEARARLLPDAEYARLAETFRALAEPSRLKIVYALLRHELCTCDLAPLVGLTESAVSQHLRGLRALRLVRSRRDGKNVFHTLDDAHIETLLDVCLEHVRGT